MKNLRVQRFVAKLHEIYDGKIDLSDVTGDSSVAFLTRALAAFTIVMKTGISYDESSKHIVDGFDDLGIDLIYRDDLSKKLYLIQAKFHQDGKGSISQGDTLKFCSGVEKIIDSDIDDANEKIKRKMPEAEAALEDPNYKISLIVVYTSDENIGSPSKQELEKICQRTNDPQNEITTYEVIQLQNIYSALLSSNTSEINLENVEIANWGCYLEDENIRGVYGVVPAGLIGKWWNDYKAALLAKNIRNFKGVTDVNKGMKKTLQEAPENFIYYNNGIKIVADKILRSGFRSSKRDLGHFDIKNASIVNGAQTVGSIGEIFSSNPDLLESANVFVQVISLDGRDVEFGTSITRLSNTQNRIESKDFVGLDNDFHKKLKEDFALDQIGYSYKSGEDTSLYERKCDIDSVAASLGCYLDDVDISTIIKRQFGSIYDNLNGRPYTQIFSSNVTNYLVWNCVVISRKMDQELKRYQQSHSGTEKALSIHGNRFLLHMFYQKIKAEQSYANIKTEYLSCVDNCDSEISQFIGESIDKIKTVITENFANSYPAYIFKNAQKCKTIKEKMLEIVDA